MKTNDRSDKSTEKHYVVMVEISEFMSGEDWFLTCIIYFNAELVNLGTLLRVNTKLPYKSHNKNSLFI